MLLEYGHPHIGTSAKEDINVDLAYRTLIDLYRKYE